MSEKSLLRKIKNILRLGGGGDESPDESDAGVTIERERGGDGTGAASDTGSPAGATEPPTRDSGTESSTAPAATDSPTADATTAADDDADTQVADSSTTRAVTDSSEGQAGREDSGSAASAEPVDAVKGIGPTYSDRLADVGIETVAQLAEADPETVADAAQTGETKAENWIERARNQRP